MRKPMRPEMKPLTDEDGEVRELTAEDSRNMRPLSEIDSRADRGGQPRIPAQDGPPESQNRQGPISASDWPPTSSGDLLKASGPSQHTCGVRT